MHPWVVVAKFCVVAVNKFTNALKIFTFNSFTTGRTGPSVARKYTYAFYKTLSYHKKRQNSFFRLVFGVSRIIIPRRLKWHKRTFHTTLFSARIFEMKKRAPSFRRIYIRCWAVTNLIEMTYITSLDVRHHHSLFWPYCQYLTKVCNNVCVYDIMTATQCQDWFISAWHCLGRTSNFGVKKEDLSNISSPHLQILT